MRKKDNDLKKYKTFECRLKFPDGDTIKPAELMPVGKNRFILRTFTMAEDFADFGDTIEARQVGKNTWLAARRIKKTNWSLRCRVISASLAKSQTLSADLSRVLKAGGHWERIFGGVLMIAMPPKFKLSPPAEMKRLKEFLGAEEK